MKAARLTLPLALVLGLLVASSSTAQEPEAATAPSPPDFESLSQNWWDYFEGSQEEVGPRVETFLARANDEIAALGAQNQELAPAVLEAVRDNLQVYQTLLGGLEIQRDVLSAPEEAYAIDDLITVAARARDARAAADEAGLEVEREQRILDGATRRRDGLFKDYLDASAGDDRWLAALRVVRARSALAISERRLDILTQSAEHAAAFAENSAERVELVQQRLTTDVDETALEALVQAVEAAADAVAAAEERQREAQIAASGL